MIGGRGVARIEALVSGPAVLALFAWFVLTACEELSFEVANDPPSPGPDAVYDGVPVHENPDGSTTFGTFHCDGQGKYVGGGDPNSEKRFNDALKSQLENAKNEIKSIDNELQRCGGKKKFQYEYDTQAGCDRASLSSYAERSRVLGKQISDTELSLNSAKGYHAQLAEGVSQLQSSIQNMRRMVEHPTLEESRRESMKPITVPTLKDDLRVAEGSLGRHTDDMNAARKGVAEEQKRLEELTAERTKLDNQAAANNQRCSAAQETAKSDNCSDANFNRLNDRRSSLRTQAAVHQNNKDRFDKCTDDRKRQAKAQQERARPAIDPSFILNQPGIWNRPTSRPSKPAPSQPSHPHKE